MGYKFRDIDSKNITCMNYGKQPMIALDYEDKVIWRSPYSIITVGMDESAIGNATVTATGDVISCLPNFDKSMVVIRAKIGGTCTVKITPNAGLTIKQLNVDKVSKGTVDTYTFSALLPKHTMNLWINKKEEPFTDFLERSDLPDVYYSDLYTAVRAVKAAYPDGVLTQDVTISCIKRGTEIRDDSGGKPTNDRLFLAILKEFNKGGIYSLTIDGRDQYTLDGRSLGILHFDKCDNIILKNIIFQDYCNFSQSYTPNEMAAVLSTGEIVDKNKNLVICNCSFYGEYLHTDSKIYYADQAIDTKLTENVVVDNCEMLKAGAVPIKCTDIDMIEIKRCNISGSHKELIPHSSVLAISNAFSVILHDNVFNGETLREYGLSLSECLNLDIRRCVFTEFMGTVLNITGANISNLRVESCLFKRCLLVYILPYLRFILNVDQPMVNITLNSNTFYLEGEGAYFQTCLFLTGSVSVLSNYNNIYISKVRRVNTFIQVQGNIGEYKSGNNLYKAFVFVPPPKPSEISTLADPIVQPQRFVATKIIECISFKVSINLKEERSLEELISLGYEKGSIALDEVVELLDVEEKGVSYSLLPKYAIIYYAGTTYQASFDIEYKKVANQVLPTVGAYNLNGIIWDETTDVNEQYLGKNIEDGSEFAQYNIYKAPSDDRLTLQSRLTDRTKLIKFIITSDYKNFMRYGNYVLVRVTCRTDETGLYQSNTMYDVELIREVV